MKKAVALIIAMVLAFGFALPLSAATLPGKLILGNEVFLNEGDVKTISVTIENVEAVSVIQFVVNYDSEKLELQNVKEKVIGGETVDIVEGAEVGTILEGLDPQISQPEVGKVSIIWEGQDSIEGEGVIANLTFKALEDGIGKSGLALSKDADDEFIFKADSEDNIPTDDIVDIENVEEDPVEVKYTVTFDDGEGTGAPAEVKSVLGNVTIPETVPTRENWTFLYWFDDEGSYEPGSTFEISEDKELVAAWAPNWKPAISLGTVKGDPGATVGVPVNVTNSKEAPSSYKLTFSAGDAAFVNFVEEGTGIPVSGVMGTAYFKIPDTAKDGAYYNVTATVDEWKIEEAYGIETISVTKGKINVERSTFNVTFDANRGTGAPAVQIKNRGTELTLSETTPTRAGYEFLGWAKTATATTAQYQPGASYSTDADITLYAVWKELPVPKVVVGDAKGRAGETVEVLVSIKNNPGISYLNLPIVYDKEIFELVSIEGKGLEGSWQFGKNATFMGEDSFYNGVILSIKLKIKEDASEGENIIEIRNVSANNYNEDIVDFIAENGKVVIYDYISGDVTGDGMVDGRDLTRLHKYLAEVPGTIIDIDAADVTGDGMVDGRDLTRLHKYLAEVPGTELN